MKKETKEILDEMIFFKSKWREQNFESLSLLTPAIKELTARTIYFCIGSILIWPKKLDLFDGFDEEDTFTDTYFEIDNDDIDNKAEYERFKPFFELCPSLNSFLKLEENKISFIDDVSKEEQEEIIKYVQDNFQERIRWRTRI